MDYPGRSRCGVSPETTDETAPEAKEIVMHDFLNRSSLKREPIIRGMEWDPVKNSREVLLDREWIVTNGLGGFASGTVSGAITRRYHGLLIAALPAPHGRVVMWNHVSEFLHFADGEIISLGAEERAGGQLNLKSADYLREFRLEDGLPVWVYHVRGAVIEKRVLLPHLQNTVHVAYHLIEGESGLRLELRPAFQFRHHETAVSDKVGPYSFTAVETRYEISAIASSFPPLRLKFCGTEPKFTMGSHEIHQVVYRSELSRGYAYEGNLWSPGFFAIDLTNNGPATLIASTEPWEIIDVLSPEQVLASERERRTRLLEDGVPEAREGIGAELSFAADQFVITPAGRFEEAARAHAAGDEVRTVIAGYHWFTDWGRDTMISLEGLTLTTGRWLEAGYILRTFAYYIRDGLIPNMFPDGSKEGRYNTADATLWFFHALHRYIQATNDQTTLKLLLPSLVDIIEQHLRGTKFHIAADPEDALLRQGTEGYQLTWMDAKMGDWVVTPRRGKAVEINALWYNALRLISDWLRLIGEPMHAQRYEDQAKRARASFNQRFWYGEGGYLYDVVDCNGQEQTYDRSCRPNQIFAISLDHP